VPEASNSMNLGRISNLMDESEIFSEELGDQSLYLEDAPTTAVRQSDVEKLMQQVADEVR
jgi:excinuclease UvrABC ATPase subunit